MQRLFRLGAAVAGLLLLRRGWKEVLLLDGVGLEGGLGRFSAHPANVELPCLLVLAQDEFGSR